MYFLPWVLKIQSMFSSKNKRKGYIWIDYCKRWYFRVINFSRFAAQKHIRGLLNSRWADAQFLYCTINIIQWMIYFTSMYVTGQHKNKQISDRLEYICINTMVNTQLLRVPKCAYKISQIFSRVLNSRLLKNRESAKINVPRIFPRLQ